MKKLLSLALVLTMVMSLFVGVTANAYNENDKVLLEDFEQYIGGNNQVYYSSLAPRGNYNNDAITPIYGQDEDFISPTAFSYRTILDPLGANYVVEKGPYQARVEIRNADGNQTYNFLTDSVTLSKALVFKSNLAENIVPGFNGWHWFDIKFTKAAAANMTQFKTISIPMQTAASAYAGFAIVTTNGKVIPLKDSATITVDGKDGHEGFSRSPITLNGNKYLALPLSPVDGVTPMANKHYVFNLDVTDFEGLTYNDLVNFKAIRFYTDVAKGGAGNTRIDNIYGTAASEADIAALQAASAAKAAKVGLASVTAIAGTIDAQAVGCDYSVTIGDTGSYAKIVAITRFKGEGTVISSNDATVSGSSITINMAGLAKKEVTFKVSVKDGTYETYKVIVSRKLPSVASVTAIAGTKDAVAYTGYAHSLTVGTRGTYAKFSLNLSVGAVIESVTGGSVSGKAVTVSMLDNGSPLAFKEVIVKLANGATKSTVKILVQRAVNTVAEINLRTASPSQTVTKTGATEYTVVISATSTYVWLMPSAKYSTGSILDVPEQNYDKNVDWRCFYIDMDGYASRTVTVQAWDLPDVTTNYTINIVRA